MPRIARTAKARQDLKEIGRHLARESASRDVAVRFLTTIREKCTLYATEPELGESCPELGTAVRRFSIGSYVVFYRPVRDGIDILRVLHGSRDIPTAWRKAD